MTSRRGGDEKIVTFWQLLRSRRRLLRSMRSALARRGDILLNGRPMPHYGSGCKKGVLRLLAFATFGEQYDVDSQASRSPASSASLFCELTDRPRAARTQMMKFMLLLLAYEWEKFVQEVWRVTLRGGEPAAHYDEGAAPIIAKEIRLFVAAAKRAKEPMGKAFIARRALRVFEAYTKQYSEIRQLFDEAGKLLTDGEVALRPADGLLLLDGRIEQSG